MKNILFFGDSLTAGYGLSAPRAQSFPALLAQRALIEGTPFTYTNAGISGDTTTSALLRLPPLLKSSYDIVVIGLGANDMLRGHAPTSMSQNLEQIINQIKQAQPKAQILLLGMELPAWITASRASQYQHIYSRLADRHQLTYLPFLLEEVIGNRALNLPDLVHPNAKGYQQVAQHVWPLLKPLL
ncbi:MAG: arylesterase [Pedobacter sp.]|nr:MAG: arylesterase [Pedobacter sp.]